MAKGRKNKKGPLINDDPYQFVKAKGPATLSSVALSPEELLRRLGESGLTDEEIAACFGLNRDAFRKILDNNPHLREILTQAKTVPDKKVEGALFRRALGYQVREVHKVEGKPAKVIIKEIAPDVVADIFWLKNRDPKRWRDTLEVKHTLRDQFDRAHQMLRMGQGSGAILPEKVEDSGELEN